MAKIFKKGDLVTFLQNWDRRGTVRINHLTVHSCGAKQMILVNTAGAKFQGSFFSPAGDDSINRRVLPRLSDDAAEAAALAFAADILAHERAHFANCLTRSTTPGYLRAIQESIAALHEPRTLRGEG